MPMDGLSVSFVVQELREALEGGRVDKVTQPERDELNLLVRNHGRNHLLLISASAGCARMHLTDEKKVSPLEPPMLCMLLRKHVVGGRLAQIRQVEGDRIVEVVFEHVDELGERAQKTLICEFMGRHSNLIFIGADGRILDSARRVTEQMSSVREVLPGLDYRRPPAHGKIPFDAPPEQIAAALRPATGLLYKAVAGAVSGLSLPTARELVFRASGEEEARAEQVDMDAVALGVARALEDVRAQKEPMLLCAPDGEVVDVTAFAYQSRAALERRRFDTLSEALDAFYRARDRAERIRQKSAALNKVLKNNIERCERKLALQQEALQGSERMEEYRVKGELLTAALHLARKGIKSVEVPNYYAQDMAPVKIELDEKLSPGQNAQRYFKLYQKARSARSLAAEQIEKTRAELDYLEGQALNLRACEEENELAELRQELEKYGYVHKNHNRRQIKKLEPSRPLRFDAPDGSVIFVGKNNLQNDRLTAEAEPNEWWLHAKDMPGSHVIVANAQAGEEALLMAARLAARYSSGAAAGKVAVDMTRRKYVKKPAGAKPGFVVYTNQTTVLAQPWQD